MWKQIATGAACLAVITAAGALLVAQATPEPDRAVRNVSISRLASGQSFAPVCKASEIVDSRPDPAWVGASFAGDNCQAPVMPAVLNGSTASRVQVVASMAAMRRYTAASDAFQRCIVDFVAAKRAQAEKINKPLSNSLVIIENHRILASESNKKKATAQVRAAIVAFNEYGSECP
jgi:hypothetical protein